MSERRRSDLRHDTEAISPVIGTILLVAIAVTMAGAMWMLLGEYSQETKAPKFPASQAQPAAAPTDGLDSGFLNLEHVAGDCIPVADLRFTITAPDGTDFEPMVTDIGNGDGEWCVTEKLSFGETQADQLGALALGQTIDLRIIHLPSENVVYDRLILLKV